MDKDVTDEAAGSAEGGPAATASRAAIVEALPGELGAGGTVARAVAHVEIGFDGDKHQFAAILAAERNVRRSEQVHLGDPPPPGEGAGEAGWATAHVVAPISFGSRTRL